MNAILVGKNNFEVNDLLTIINDEEDEHDFLQIQGANEEENFVMEKI